MRGRPTIRTMIDASSAVQVPENAALDGNLINVPGNVEESGAIQTTNTRSRGTMLYREAKVTDRPIIMHPISVRALDGGRKTQTRRILKPQRGVKIAEFVDIGPAAGGIGRLLQCPRDRLCVPYAVGDLLWVREKLSWADDWVYGADGGHVPGTRGIIRRKFTKTVPSIHMPRWASRFTLTVTEVRV